jgi:acyl-CoA thioester hydrolase
MDAFGHINHARYLTYFEEARIKYLDDIINWTYGWSTKGIIMARAEVDYISPGHFKDELIVLTRCSRLGNKSITIEYKLIKKQAKAEITIATATTVVVMYDYKSETSIPIPEDWRSAISKYEGMG